MAIESQNRRKRAIRTIVLVTAVMTAAACSERRSTEPCKLPEPPEPVVSTKLPAMDITENPIAARSGQLKTWPRESACFESEFVIEIPESFLDQAEHIDEIVFHYSGLRGAEIWFYDVARTEWRGLAPLLYWGAYPFRRFLSEMGSPPGDFLIDQDGIMRIGTNGVDSIWVELLHYHDDYKAVSLPERDRLGCLSHCQAEIVSVNGMLWIVPTVRQNPMYVRYPCGTMHVLDSAGLLLFSSILDPRTPRAVTNSAGTVWTLSKSFRDMYEMSTLDAAGVITPQFHYYHSPFPGRFPPEHEDNLLASGFDRLWVHVPWSNRLFGIPIEQIADGDPVHHDWRFSFRELAPRTVITGVVCDGSYFYVQGYDERDGYKTITKINLSGQAVAVYPVPVYSTGAMAWDGEAMWLVHTGPRGTESQGLMVSRFRLP